MFSRQQRCNRSGSMAIIRTNAKPILSIENLTQSGSGMYPYHREESPLERIQGMTDPNDITEFKRGLLGKIKPNPAHDLLPSDMLKLQVLKNMSRKKRPHRGLGVTPAGGGINPAGDGHKKRRITGRGPPLKEGIVNMVSRRIVPSLLSTLGVKKSPIPLNKINQAIHSALKNHSLKDLPSLAKKLSKPLLAIALHSTISKKQRGSGLLNKALKTHKEKLLKSISSDLHGALKTLLVKKGLSSKKRLHGPLARGSGLTLAGQRRHRGLGFKKFFKGFKKVWSKHVKPHLTLKNLGKASKVGGIVATALGNPEVGVVLGSIGKALD